MSNVPQIASKLVDGFRRRRVVKYFFLAGNSPRGETFERMSWRCVWRCCIVFSRNRITFYT